MQEIGPIKRSHSHMPRPPKYRVEAILETCKLDIPVLPEDRNTVLKLPRHAMRLGVKTGWICLCTAFSTFILSEMRIQVDFDMLKSPVNQKMLWASLRTSQRVTLITSSISTSQAHVADPPLWFQMNSNHNMETCSHTPSLGAVRMSASHCRASLVLIDLHWISTGEVCYLDTWCQKGRDLGRLGRAWAAQFTGQLWSVVCDAPRKVQPTHEGLRHLTGATWDHCLLKTQTAAKYCEFAKWDPKWWPSLDPQPVWPFSHFASRERAGPACVQAVTLWKLCKTQRWDETARGGVPHCVAVWVSRSLCWLSLWAAWMQSSVAGEMVRLRWWSYGVMSWGLLLGSCMRMEEWNLFKCWVGLDRKVTKGSLGYLSSMY